MGNLITASTTVFIPLFIKKIIMPFFFHPYNNGSIPWTPPNGFTYNIVSIFFTLIILIGIGTISGIMATLSHCNKYEYGKSIFNTKYIIFGYFLANIILFIIPIIKAPLLVVLIWLPYADYIVHGIYTAIFVLLFGALGNSRLIHDICE
jgi:hypothetical protein